MAITQHQLDGFHKFATNNIKDTGPELSWAELFAIWRIENATTDQQAEVYQALDESLEGMENGRHRPSNEALDELRAKHNLSQ